MHVRDWLRPPRQLLSVFLAVALVSAAAFGWLGVLLFDQDKTLEVEQRQERLEQAADRAVAVMQRTLATLQANASPPPDRDRPLPSGVLMISVESGVVTVAPEGSLPYFPVVATVPEAPATTFVEGERMEFAAGALSGA